MATESTAAFEVSRTAERLSLGLAILVVILIGVVSSYDWNQLDKDTRETTRTRDILAQVDGLLSTIKDAETGQRGYLLTGKPEYLEPYHQATATLRSRVETIRALVAERPFQLERLEKMRPLIDAKLVEMDRTIEVRRLEGEEPARAIVLSDRGNGLMNQIRSGAAEMTETAYRRLADQSQAAQTRATRTWLVSVGGSGLLLILVVAASVLIHRGTNRRQTLIKQVVEQERETARAKDLLYTTLASIGDAVIATDKDGRVTFLNAVAQSLTAWTQAEAAGVHLDEVFRIVNEDTRVKVESPVAKALHEGTVVGLANHTILLAKDGIEHPIDDSAAPIRDDKRNVIGVVLIFRDVAERRAAEKALEQSRQETERERELLGITLASIGDAVIATDDSGAVRFLNPVAEQLTGWTSQDASGRPVEDVFPIINEATLDKVENPLRRALDQGEIVGLTNYTLLIAKDGRKIAIDDSAAPIRDDHGKIAGAVLVFRDISRRRQAERALEASEKRFRSVFAQAPIGMVLTNLDGLLVRCNQAYSEITGYSTDELATIKHLSLTHPDEVAYNTRLFEELLSGQRASYVIEKRIIRKTGESAWVRASATLLRDTDGQAAQVVGLVENIDARKQAEVRLSQVARLSQLGAGVGRALTQCEGLQESLQLCASALVQHLDVAFARIWTVSEDAAFLELRASAGMYTHLNGAHSRIQVGSLKIGLIAQEGKPHLTNDVATDDRVSDRQWAAANGMVAFAGYPLMVGSKVVGVMGMFARKPLPTDTLDTLCSVADTIAIGIKRRQAELGREAALEREATARVAAERSAKALERSNQDLQEFAHAASHDLRSPLRTVNLMATMLSRQYQGKLSADADELLGFITSGVVRMDSLISDLLSFAQATEVEVASTPVALEQAVSEAMDNLRASIDECGAVITTTGLPTVLAHKTQLLQLFQNLIGNGIKYRSERAPQICINAELKDSAWLISVSDNGIGFNAQYAREIFGAFKRLHGSDYPGNGIGLATCKRIVESFGGAIWAESEEGHGSTFYFTLPVVKERKRAAPEG